MTAPDGVGAAFGAAADVAGFGTDELATAGVVCDVGADVLATAGVA